MNQSVSEHVSEPLEVQNASTETLSLEEILQGLQAYPEDSGLPRQVLAGAIARRDEVTPHLLAWIGQAYGPDADQDGLKVNFALYLLSQFSEPKACPLILQLLRLPDDELDMLLGDGLTEDGRRYLISTYDGNWEALVELALDEAANEFSRSAAIGAMSGLLRTGRVEHKQVIMTWKDLLQRWRETDQPDRQEVPMSGLVIEVARHRLSELRQDLEAALASESFDPMMISSEEVIQRLDSQEDDPGFFDNWHHYRPITDVFAEFGKWQFFQTPAERIEAAARLEEMMARYRENLARENPELARKLFDPQLNDPFSAWPQGKAKRANKSMKQKRKQQSKSRKQNRRK